MSEALKKQVGGDHYRKMEIQPIEFICRNKIGFAEGCVIKYVCRYRHKDGLHDLEKAIHTLELLIDLEYPKGSVAEPTPPVEPCDFLRT